ncbi:MAG: glycosyltransferase family 4 protein [Candidatus Omnitrophica bacterium]|nr:glycosyltransferase family 4 protein [Candidatus Omnitrophota bacterium]
MKKILFVSTNPLSFKAFNMDLFYFLQQKEFEVHAAAGYGNEIDFLQEKGVVFHQLEIPRKINVLKDLKAGMALMNLIKKEKFDIVHSQTSKAGFIARLAAKFTGVRVIVHNVGGWAFNEFLPNYKKTMYLFLERAAGLFCDVVIAVSKFVKDDGINYNVLPENKIELVYNGVNTTRFKPISTEEKTFLKKERGLDSTKTIIGTVSRIVKDKGIEDIISAAKLLKDNETVFFVIVGDGEKRIDYERKVKEEGLEQNFLFTGYSANIDKWMNVFDVFLLPTLREGFGVVFAEAQSSGIPVIGTDIPALREVVLDGQSGFLVEPCNCRKLADKINLLLNKVLCDNMGQKGREHVVENFSSEQNSIKTYEIYKKIWEKKFKKALNE